MNVSRDSLYRFPWSRTDNPGAWIEVTDACDLHCPGCYRRALEGHRPLAELKQEILALRDMLHCDRIAIAGGEPLLYPDLVEVVRFIARHGMKPMILTNGETLTRDLAAELKRAGLVLFYFHIDANQQRPGWVGKTEDEMNILRQRYADMLWDLGGVQCGYNITVFPSTMASLPAIISWARTNIHKVQHVSLIAFRSLLLGDDLAYEVNGRPIDTSLFHCTTRCPDDLSVTTDRMAELLMGCFPEVRPCAYLNGTTSPESLKFLIMLPIGTTRQVYGALGPKTAELVQVFHHLRRGRYCAFQQKSSPGMKIFLLSLVDGQVRKALGQFLKASLRNPKSLLEKIYVQCINIQQPNEVLRGRRNQCEGCLNLMLYQGRLIHSCQLDEYRIYGGPIEPREKRIDLDGSPERS